MHTMRFSGGTSVSGAAPCGKYTTTEPSSVMLNHCAYSTADDCTDDRPCDESDDWADDASPAQVQAQTSHVARKSAARGRIPGNMAEKRAILRRMPAMLRPRTLSRADFLATWPGYL